MVSSIRFSGLASGMDTQSMVDAIMQAERIPLNNLYKKKQLLEWKRDDYRSMNLLLNEFDTFIFDGIYKQANMLKKTVTSSNSEYVTATATASAGNVSYDLKVKQLATAARQKSEYEVSGTNGKIDPTKSLWSQRNNFANTIIWNEKKHTDNFTVPEESNGQFYLSKKEIDLNGLSEITVGGNTFKVRTEISSENPLKSDEVYIDQSTGVVKFGDPNLLAAGADFSIEYTYRYLDIGVKTYNENGEEQIKNFTFEAGMSLNSMFSTINSSNAGVNIFYDEFSDKVVAMRTATGDFNENGNEIVFISRDADGKEIENNKSFFYSVLGLQNETGGQNAKFEINGLVTERKSNTFTINGVTFTLKKVTAENESVTINTNTDVDSIVQTIKDFVNKYNEVIGKINDKLNEKKYSDYEPLTDEEKEALSEKEIEKWEEKAKSGLLRRDSLLSNALDKMRVLLYQEVVSNEKTLTNPKYNQLAEIGITTSSNYYERGKLEIDEDKLRAAIEEDPEAVYRLFMANGETTSEQGLARRLRSALKDTIKSIEERAGNSFKTEYSYTIGKQILDYNDRISSFEDRLQKIEERYWKQFTAMEKALQDLNSQTNMLYSYLGMSSGK